MEKYRGKGGAPEMKGSQKGEGPLVSRSGGNKGQGISDGERG